MLETSFYFPPKMKRKISFGRDQSLSKQKCILKLFPCLATGQGRLGQSGGRAAGRPFGHVLALWGGNHDRRGSSRRWVTVAAASERRAELRALVRFAVASGALVQSYLQNGIESRHPLF